jgi:inorganic triphosphatase YgiF
VSGVEREIKLSAGDDFSMPDLSEAGFSIEDHGSDTLNAVYLDTPELELFHSGHGLRFRHGASLPGRWTLKGPSQREGGALVRSELEIDGERDVLPPAIRLALPAGLDITALQPVLAMRTRRHRRVVTDPDAEACIEVVDDLVEVLDGDATVERYRELEVEIIDGDALADAQRVVALLRAHGAGDPESQSKLGRGLRALGRL